MLIKGVIDVDLEAMKTAEHKVVGVKQTTKALKNGKALLVFVAGDAEERMTAPLREACEEHKVECLTAESMQALGKACGIHAGAAAAAILKP